MPQLWPLGWIFLFVFFWSMVMLMAVSVWWMFKTEFSVEVSDYDINNRLINKWEW